MSDMVLALKVVPAAAGPVSSPQWIQEGSMGERIREIVQKNITDPVSESIQQAVEASALALYSAIMGVIESVMKFIFVHLLGKLSMVMLLLGLLAVMIVGFKRISTWMIGFGILGTLVSYIAALGWGA